MSRLQRTATGRTLRPRRGVPDRAASPLSETKVHTRGGGGSGGGYVWCRSVAERNRVSSLSVGANSDMLFVFCSPFFFFLCRNADGMEKSATAGGRLSETVVVCMRFPFFSSAQGRAMRTSPRAPRTRFLHPVLNATMITGHGARATRRRHAHVANKASRYARASLSLTRSMRSVYDCPRVIPDERDVEINWGNRPIAAEGTAKGRRSAVA